MDFRSMAMRVASATEAARKKKKPKKSRKTKKTRRVRKSKPRTSQPKKPIEPEPEPVEEEVSTEDILAPKTEYSCQLQVSIIADFEGDVDKNKLLRKLKNETIGAIEAGVATTAREYGLEATQVTVKPIGLECAVNSVE